MHPKGVRNLLLQLLFAVIPAILTLSIESLSVMAENPAVAFAQEVTMILLFPGMLISMAGTGTVHAWPLGVAGVANLLFYFVLIRLGVRLYSSSSCFTLRAMPYAFDLS